MLFFYPPQQSAAVAQLLPTVVQSSKQLFVPQTEWLAQSSSLSQSPSPIVHGDDGLQQSQSVLGWALHVVSRNKIRQDEHLM